MTTTREVHMSIGILIRWVTKCIIIKFLCQLDEAMECQNNYYRSRHWGNLLCLILKLVKCIIFAST